MAGDAWKKGMAMVADGDAGNRWGNNGKVAVGVCGAVLAELLPAADRQPSWNRGRARGRRREEVALLPHPGVGIWQSCHRSSQERSLVECVDDPSVLPLCMSLLTEKAFTYIYL